MQEKYAIFKTFSISVTSGKASIYFLDRIFPLKTLIKTAIVMNM